MQMTKSTHRLNILLFGVSVFMVGCASKTECYARHQAVRAECQDFLKHESDTKVRDPQMNQCMRNKGYPDGADTCLR